MWPRAAPRDHETLSKRTNCTRESDDGRDSGTPTAVAPTRSSALITTRCALWFIVAAALWTGLVVYACMTFLHAPADESAEKLAHSRSSLQPWQVPQQTNRWADEAEDPEMPALRLPTNAAPKASGDNIQTPSLEQQLLASLKRAAARVEQGAANGHSGANPNAMVALEVSSHEQYDPTNVEPDDSNRFRPFYQKLYTPVDLHPDNCTNGPQYLSMDSESLHQSTISERCHVCERIYRNSLLWNWKWHYNALCNLVPDHLKRLCYNYACVMASSCPEFITATCSDGDVRMSPCPAKIVCWNCLQIPKVQAKGCFDGTSGF